MERFLSGFKRYYDLDFWERRKYIIVGYKWFGNFREKLKIREYVFDYGKVI